MPQLLKDRWRITLLALALRGVAVFWAWSHIPPAADGTFYHRLAERLASGQGYTWLWDDGAVTYAAHYPVGYPALLAGPYALFGAVPGVGMVVNAVVGALASWAVHRLLCERGRGVAAAGALLVALHPGLVLYTPALMTEGVVAALWVFSVAIADEGKKERGRRRWLWVATCGLCLGVATLVRPQSVLLAPVLGASMFAGARLPLRSLGAAAVTVAAVLCCLPWTMRNCERMGRCAFVSVNGGWNLLIGTQPEGHGAWSEIRVPSSCRTVFDEAAKDACFAAAARDRIREAPGTWLSLAPAKLHATFDYCGAAPWYLREANGAAFDDDAKRLLGTVETVFERLVLLAALIGGWASFGPRSSTSRRSSVVRGLRGVVLAVGLGFCLQRHATLAFVALALLLVWREERHIVDVGTATAIGLLVVVHAAFFGAGRYQLVLWPLMCAVAASHAGYLARHTRAAAPPSPTSTRTKR